MAAAPSQPNRPGVSRSDHSADTKKIGFVTSFRTMVRTDMVDLGVGKREKERKEVSKSGSQDELAQGKEENGSWTNSAKRKVKTFENEK